MSLSNDFFYEVNLNKINLERKNVLLNAKNNIDKVQDYKKIRNLIFNILGLFTYASQSLELTLQTYLYLNDELNFRGPEIENEIHNNVDYLVETIFNSNIEVNKDKNRLKRLIDKALKDEFISDEFYNDLDCFRDIRNNIIHSSIVTNPFLFSKLTDMKQFIYALNYYTFIVIEYVESIQNIFTIKYNRLYPSIVSLIDKSISKFNKLNNEIIQSN